jgi:hypothetical protein
VWGKIDPDQPITSTSTARASPLAKWRNGGAVEFGWPLMLVAPLTIAQGRTGVTSAAAALAALGSAAARHAHALAACTGILTVAAGGTGGNLFRSFSRKA